MTPLTKNFLSPSKKNFALGRIREFVVCVMSSGVETSLDAFFDLDGETPPAFAQSYSRASAFAVGLATFAADVFGRASPDRIGARRSDAIRTARTEWRALPIYSFANASRTTAPVRSMSPDVCAVEMKPVSN